VLAAVQVLGLSMSLALGSTLHSRGPTPILVSYRAALWCLEVMTVFDIFLDAIEHKAD